MSPHTPPPRPPRGLSLPPAPRPLPLRVRSRGDRQNKKKYKKNQQQQKKTPTTIVRSVFTFYRLFLTSQINENKTPPGSASACYPHSHCFGFTSGDFGAFQESSGLGGSLVVGAQSGFGEIKGGLGVSPHPSPECRGTPTPPHGLFGVKKRGLGGPGRRRCYGDASAGRGVTSGGVRELPVLRSAAGKDAGSGRRRRQRMRGGAWGGLRGWLGGLCRDLGPGGPCRDLGGAPGGPWRALRGPWGCSWESL